MASWAPKGVNRARSPQGIRTEPAAELCGERGRHSPAPALCLPLAQPEQQVLGALQVWAPPVGTVGERLAPVLGHQRLTLRSAHYSRVVSPRRHASGNALAPRL